MFVLVIYLVSSMEHIWAWALGSDHLCWSQCDMRHSDALSAENKHNCVFIRAPEEQLVNKTSRTVC